MVDYPSIDVVLHLREEYGISKGAAQRVIRSEFGAKRGMLTENEKKWLSGERRLTPGRAIREFPFFQRYPDTVPTKEEKEAAQAYAVKRQILAEEEMERKRQESLRGTEIAYRNLQSRLFLLNMGILGVNMSFLGLQYTFQKIPGVTKESAEKVRQFASSIQFVLSIVNMMLSMMSIYTLYRAISFGGWTGLVPGMMGAQPVSLFGGASSVSTGRNTGSAGIVINNITSSSPTYVERTLIRSLKLAKG